MYMGLFPGHESLTKYVSCGCKQILTWVYFYSAWFLEICWCSFRSASRHQYIYVYNTQHIYMCCVGLYIYIYIYIYDSFPLAWSTTDFLITQPPLQTQKLDAWFKWTKQNLTWVYFYSAWFLKNLLGSFPSASRHQRVQKSRFTRPLEPNQVCASFPLAFWTQTNFDMVYFPSAWFLQNLLGYVSLSFTASTCREESFHLALRT